MRGRVRCTTEPMTLRNKPSVRLTCVYPPIGADFGSMPITTLAVQIWAFCAPTSRADAVRWLMWPGPMARRLMVRARTWYG